MIQMLSSRGWTKTGETGEHLFISFFFCSLLSSSSLFVTVALRVNKHPPLNVTLQSCTAAALSTFHEHINSIWFCQKLNKELFVILGNLSFQCAWDLACVYAPLLVPHCCVSAAVFTFSLCFWFLKGTLLHFVIADSFVLWATYWLLKVWPSPSLVFPFRCAFVVMWCKSPAPSWVCLY